MEARNDHLEVMRSEIALLQHHWRSFGPHADKDKKPALRKALDFLDQKWWKEIVQWHSPSSIPPRRQYHTLSHLAEMFGHFNRYLTKLKDPRAVALSIFFHDIIYDPESKTNEEDSAEVFIKFGEEAKLEERLVAKVKAYILATKSHEHGPQVQSDPDLALFLDFDMAVLGRPLAGYMAYAAQIRQEFLHFPVNGYCEGRAKVLRGFLAMGNVFASAEFRTAREATARANIEAEIAELEAGRVPLPLPGQPDTISVTPSKKGQTDKKFQVYKHPTLKERINWRAVRSQLAIMAISGAFVFVGYSLIVGKRKKAGK